MQQQRILLCKVIMKKFKCTTPIEFVQQGKLEELASKLTEAQQLISKAQNILSDIQTALTLDDQDFIYLSYRFSLEQIVNIKNELDALIRHAGNDWALSFKEIFLKNIDQNEKPKY
jgi:hypothetical protein